MGGKCIDVNKLPTKFRGCHFDDGWEFDGPTVIYYPWKYRAYSPDHSNSGGIETLLECMLIDICLENDISGYQKGLDNEIKWRRWGKRFDKREKACHLEIIVKWYSDKDGELSYDWDLKEIQPETRKGEYNAVI